MKPVTVALLLLLLVKWWVIWPYEIVDATDDPIVYIAQVANPGIGACYGPGTGFFGHLFYTVSIPYRLGLEAVFQLALYLQVAALLGWPHQKGLACLGYGVALFNPNWAEISSHLLSDPVWTVFTMTGVSLWGLYCQGMVSKVVAIPMAVLFLLAGLTRPLTVPLFLCFMAFPGVCYLLIWLSKSVDKRKLSVSITIPALLLMVTTLLPYKLWLAMDPYGYGGTSSLDSRAFVNLYMTFQSVGEPDGIPYFPVGEERRALIATAGPLCKKLMAEIDDPQGPCAIFKGCGDFYYGVHDIPEGWVQCAVEGESPLYLGPRFKYYSDLEQEIHQAHAEGRLPVRSILPLPDCRLEKVFSVLPKAMVEAYFPLVYQPAHFSGTFPTARFDMPIFTKYLNRRNVHPDELHNWVTWSICLIYRAYFPLLPPILGLFVLYSMMYGKIRGCSVDLPFLAQQIFLVTFTGLLACYILFSASGLPLVSRYLTYHSLLLPLLTLYYGSLAWKLWQLKRLHTPTSDSIQ
jgi:hypothetical protein